MPLLFASGTSRGQMPAGGFGVFRGLQRQRLALASAAAGWIPGPDGAREAPDQGNVPSAELAPTESLAAFVAIALKFPVKGALAPGTYTVACGSGAQKPDLGHLSGNRFSDRAGGNGMGMVLSAFASVGYCCHFRVGCPSSSNRSMEVMPETDPWASGCRNRHIIMSAEGQNVTAFLRIRLERGKILTESK